MTDREKDLAEILARLEEQRPEIERILRRPAIIDTGREPKDLCRIPKRCGLHRKRRTHGI
ncbi:MAG: hypothetical protein V8R80_00865 [Eubacterium sp.]